MWTTPLLLAVLAGSPQDSALSSQQRTAWRELFTAALAEPDSRAMAKLVSGAEEFADHRFDQLVEALRMGPLYPVDALSPREVAGELEVLGEFGPTTVGYAFEHEGERYRYALDLPPGYDPDQAWPLLLDPGHGSARDEDDETRAGMLEMYRRHANQAGLEDWIVARTEIVEQIGVGGVRGALPDDEVAEVFQAFFRDLMTRVHVDPDQVRVTGLSQTGYWAWYLARARADRLAGIAPMSAVTRLEADAYLTNLLNLPVYVLHGSDDTVTGVVEVRATCARLASLGYEQVYEELEGAGHEYAVWSHQPEALEWLAERPRDPYPKRVSKSLQTLRDPWCYWLRVDELAREGDGEARTSPTGGVDGEIDGQTVRLWSDGVESLSLFLSSELLDLDQPVRVLWNERLVHEGPVERDPAVLLGAAAEKVDWKGTFEARLAFER